MTDQEPIAAAILAALNTAFAAEAVTLPDFASVTAYDRDSVPGTLGNEGDVPATFVVISLYRIANDTRRFGGDYTMPGFFLDTAYRAQNVYGCRALRRVVSEALENQLVDTWGPFRFNDESQPIVDDDDYGFSGTDTWSFC